MRTTPAARGGVPVRGGGLARRTSWITTPHGSRTNVISSPAGVAPAATSAVTNPTRKVSGCWAGWSGTGAAVRP